MVCQAPPPLTTLIYYSDPTRDDTPSDLSIIEIATRKRVSIIRLLQRVAPGCRILKVIKPHHTNLETSDLGLAFHLVHYKWHHGRRATAVVNGTADNP